MKFCGKTAKRKQADSVRAGHLEELATVCNRSAAMADTTLFCDESLISQHPLYTDAEVAKKLQFFFKILRNFYKNPKKSNFTAKKARPNRAGLSVFKRFKHAIFPPPDSK